jgi:hypothetical protein
MLVIGGVPVSMQGTLVVRTYIKALLEEIKSRERDGVLPETLIALLKEKLKKDMDGWS